jgi:26S proteasome regulatory subunit N2
MAAAATCVSSAAGLLAMLDDESDELKRFALAKLNPLVPSYWYQISGSIASVEALSEDEGFQARELAALIASKVRRGESGRGETV